MALQNIAKRLKEENEKLRKENTLLQQKLAAAEEERDNLREMSRKRWRDDSVPQTPSYGASMPLKKRSRTQTDFMDAFSAQLNMPSPSYLSSPTTSIASSPDSNDHTSFSPIPSLPPPREGPVFAQGSALSNVFDFISSGKTNVFEPGGPLDTFNCGFCSDGTPCVCRELALQQVNNLPTPSASFKAETTDNIRVTDIRFDTSQLSPQESSILENLPAYQPPVPIRRRGGPRTNPVTIFAISQPQQSPVISSSENPASCTGDPSNCPACADDAFGKAFCAAISKSVASSSTACGNCPCGSEGTCNHTLQTTTNPTSCCGNPATCCRARENAASSATVVAGPSSFALPDQTTTTLSAPQPLSPNGRRGETIPCDDAWRQIKSHPNVAFADLDLLAEVVARRVKCTGPRVEIFPAPGSITPERGISPLTLPASFPQEQQQRQQLNVNRDARPGSSSGQQTMPSHHHFDMQSNGSGVPLVGDRERTGAPSPSLQLVPQEVLVQCGRQQRVREVHADAVRDALRLLDAKFSLP